MGTYAYVNGEYVEEANAKVSIFDRGFLFADAVYEVSSVVDGKLIENNTHLERLFRSLGELKIDFPLSKEEIEARQLELIKRNGTENGTLYLQVSRGEAPRDFILPKVAPTMIMFTTEKNVRDNPMAATGIKVKTTPDIRWGRCDVKTVALLPAAMARQSAIDEGLNDAWFVRDGVVTEGSSNNAFIVTEDGTIVAPFFDTKMLHGITRRAVLTLIEREGLKLEQRPFTPEEAYAAAEAFSTSASSFVMPVVEIDGHRIGGGQPGPIARKLRDIYVEETANGGVLG